MADLTIVTNGVHLVHADKAEIVDLIAVEAIAAGQAVYQTSAGKAGLTDADAGGKAQFRGIALKAAGAGQPVPVLKRGWLAGYVLTGVAYDGIVYLSNTAGALADAASIGGTTVNCGRCVALTDPDLTKVLYIEADWLRAWS